MKIPPIEFAPLEGATDSLFRQVHAAYFPHAARYYTPFLSPTQDHLFTNKDLREILPEHNRDICVIPQLIGHNADDFLWAAGELKAMGYTEVNLNLGCPSGTVTKKKKGAGLLGDIPMLTDFLDRIFDKAPLAVSVKTRIGRKDEAEAEALAALFARYPLASLIVHPRLEKDFYKGPIRANAFSLFQAASPCPVCYNGDLQHRGHIADFVAANPDVPRLMCGRGFIANPKLVGEAMGEAPLTKAEFAAFYEEFFARNREKLTDDRQLLAHMKEYWAYWGPNFENCEKPLKQLRKATALPDYKDAAACILAFGELRNPAGSHPAGI